MKLKKILSCAALCALPLSGGFAQEMDSSTESIKPISERVLQYMYKNNDTGDIPPNFLVECSSDYIDDGYTYELDAFYSFIDDNDLKLVERRIINIDVPATIFIATRSSNSSGLRGLLAEMDKHPDGGECRVTKGLEDDHPERYCGVTPHDAQWTKLNFQSDVDETNTISNAEYDENHPVCYSREIVYKPAWFKRLWCWLKMC